jgi:hypothetical protein
MFSVKEPMQDHNSFAADEITAPANVFEDF